MKINLALFLAASCILLAACTSSTCPEGALSYLDPPYPLEDPSPPRPQTLALGRQEISFDQVISGPLCNDTWSGTVYVSCDLQIPRWKGEGNGEEEVEPLFFEDCELVIAPDAVVYVEAHGNQPYMQGCSCHSDPGSE